MILKSNINNGHRKNCGFLKSLAIFISQILAIENPKIHLVFTFFLMFYFTGRKKATYANIYVHEGFKVGTSKLKFHSNNQTR